MDQGAELEEGVEKRRRRGWEDGEGAGLLRALADAGVRPGFQPPPSAQPEAQLQPYTDRVTVSKIGNIR